MKKIWKWILGILAVLVIAGVVAGAMFVWRNHTLANFAPVVRSQSQDRNESKGPFMHGPEGWRGPMLNDPHGWGGDRRGFGGWHQGPMMRHHGLGFSPFFGGLMILGGLLKLAFFGLLLYGAYWLGKRNAHIAFSPANATPTPAPVAPVNNEPNETPKQRGRKVAKE